MLRAARRRAWLGRDGPGAVVRTAAPAACPRAGVSPPPSGGRDPLGRVRAVAAGRWRGPRRRGRRPAVPGGPAAPGFGRVDAVLARRAGPRVRDGGRSGAGGRPDAAPAGHGPPVGGARGGDRARESRRRPGHGDRDGRPVAGERGAESPRIASGARPSREWDVRSTVLGKTVWARIDCGSGAIRPCSVRAKPVAMDRSRADGGLRRACGRRFPAGPLRAAVPAPRGVRREVRAQIGGTRSG